MDSRKEDKACCRFNDEFFIFPDQMYGYSWIYIGTCVAGRHNNGDKRKGDNRNSHTGYASLMCVVLMGFGLVFIMLSMLGEYIWRTLEESRKRPPFIIDEVHRSESNEEK